MTNLGFLGLSGFHEKTGYRTNARRVAACMVPEKLAKAAAELAELPLVRRYSRLAELGSEKHEKGVLEDICRPEYRVPGCTSIVHVKAVQDIDGKVTIQGCSDAKLTAGLVRVLSEGLNGLEKDVILGMEFSEFADATQLNSFMSSSRANAFSNVLRCIHSQLLGVTPDESQSSGGPRTFVSEGQGEDVAVLLSGGVDSSVSLRLLLEQGYRPTPFYLKIWLEDELSHLGECPWEEDLSYAESVCDQVNLKVEAVSLQQEYMDSVVKYTIQDAKAGRTPNPDVMCNSRVKFGVFLDRFGEDFSKVASGHYARTRTNHQSGMTELVCSADEWKDQTYFLAHLKQSQVENTLFPIGAYTKARVRELADEYDLPNKARKDSQGICFLGKLKFDEFLEHHLGRQPGLFLEYETGLVLGKHRGFWFYTLGQRKGLGLSGGPWYVVSKNAEENIVYISGKYHAMDKPRTVFTVESLSWISGTPPTREECAALCVKIRHGPRTAPCRLVLEENTGYVELEEKESIGLAPGQFAAFYLGDICLGSGIISADSGLEHAPKESSEVSSKRLQAHYLA
ncbi:hypothetical protein NDN08_002635 [Rhodosorus marinus]|uniref:tRNA-5-taurinomethyluridine 2-sulfurtransferase n=1 Tax=Rhodosorus marinus TaxID=101924 RepID=A0AAV8UUB7_9RHOD|nr:hypothetical protein NDN08_002635 [Rhodosorus marinus]